jgi:hypothetical protein
MKSPLVALAWEIWQRGRRSAWIVLGCLGACALVNLLFLSGADIAKETRAHYEPFFGLLMVVSFLFLIGIFNYTEFNSAKDWHGFPYRLFVLPVPTWQLVALPMALVAAAVGLLFTAWIKLVWTHGQIPMPEWFGTVLAVYAVLYQTFLWLLAGFRVLRIVTLGFGGVTSVLVIWLPFADAGPWLSKERLMAMMVGVAVMAYVIAWATVARQRSGGGRRRSWLGLVWGCIEDALPRRKKDFASAASAQFWYEWRRAGWVLPACMAFVIGAIVLPISWYGRHDAQYTDYIFGRLLAAPFVLAFVIGKAFIKCEFWSTNLTLTPFQAVRPLGDGEFVTAKLKVAAMSAAITGLLMLAFLALWLPLWANTSNLARNLWELQMFFPHSWHVILVLGFCGFVVLIWRCLVSGLWVGLSGKPWHYFGAAGMQVLIAALVLLAIGIWSSQIDKTLKDNSNLPVIFQAMGWGLALLVISKVWFAAFSWRKNPARHTSHYLRIWSGATVGFVALAFLLRPPFDTQRLAHLFLLAALLSFPLARLGLAPPALAKNRHR